MMPNRLETKPTSPLPSGLHLALLLGVLLMLNRGANAQPPPPSDPNNVNGGAGVPIDGGLSILMAAGAGLGLKRPGTLENPPQPKVTPRQATKSSQRPLDLWILKAP
jgi:hypothetical protein